MTLPLTIIETLKKKEREKERKKKTLLMQIKSGDDGVALGIVPLSFNLLLLMLFYVHRGHTDC